MEGLASKIVIYCQTLPNTSVMVDPVYIPNPDIMSTFQKQLRDLLVSVIRENKNTNTHFLARQQHHLTFTKKQADYFFEKQYLPIIPTYFLKDILINSHSYYYNQNNHPHNDDTNNDNPNIIPTGKGVLLFEQMEFLQQDALTIYFGFSLMYGLFIPEWIIETIHQEVIKRSHQSEDNINYKDWKYAVEISQAILQQHGESIITQRLPYSAQLEALTLYYYYALIKGPLDEEAVQNAKDNAFAMHCTHHENPFPSPTSTTMDEKAVTSDQEEDNDINNNSSHDADDEEDKSHLSLTKENDHNEDIQSIASNMSQSHELTSSTFIILSSEKLIPTPIATEKNEPDVKKTSWATIAQKNKDAPVKNLVVNKLSVDDHVPKNNDKTTDKEVDIKGTQLCLYYRNGGCFHRDTCTYAHEDTSRVFVCREWKKGPNLCKKGVNCQFLHSEKVTTSNKDINNSKFDLSLKKTKLCLHYKAGICPRSEKDCHFAHEQLDKVHVCDSWNGIDCYNGDECTLLHPKNTKKQQKENEPPTKKGYTRVDLKDQEDFPVLGDKRPRTCSTSDIDSNDGKGGGSYATVTAANKRQPTIKPLNKIENMEILEEYDKISCSHSSFTCDDNLSNNSNTNVKTKICEFFRKGTCLYNEDTCHYAHYDFSRVRPCFAYMNTKKCNEEWCPYLHDQNDGDNNDTYHFMSSSAQKTKLCLDYLENKCPHKNEQECEYAHKDTQKVPVCKYWRSNGLCVKDKLCQYLHEEPTNQKIDDYSIAVALDKKGYPVLNKRVEELLVKSVLRSDYNYATVARREPPPSCSSKNEDGKSINPFLCVDEMGRAPTGGVISKRRDSSTSMDEDEDGSSYGSEFVSDAKELRHTKKCRLWWDENETCHRHDCWFAHNNTNKVKECYFWKHGYCFNGNACLYMHQDRDSTVEQVANEQIDFPDEDDDNASMISWYEEDNNSFTAETKRTRKCMHFWFGEGCTRESDKCRYAHEDLRYVSTCYYWQNNKKCPSESTCAYKHDEKPREKVWDDKERKDIYVKSPPTPFLHQTTSSQLAKWRKKLLTPPSSEILPRLASDNERNERRYISLRSHAIKWGKKMNEETERAAKAKQEGRLEDAESHEKRAYEYSGRMRRENAKASQAIFNECNNPRNRNRFIDLHGQHIAEAKQHIKRWFDDFQTQRDVVYIVTGAGRHSRNNKTTTNSNNNTISTMNSNKKGQLREAIQDYLKRLYLYNETNVYGDDMGGVFAVLFCVHEYPSKHSRKCHKCEYIKCE